MDLKALLRQELRTKRLNLSPDGILIISKKITSQLQELLSEEDLSNIHCYEPIAELNEVDIRQFLDWLRSIHPQVHLYTSKKSDGEWRVVALTEDESVEVPKFDVIIVPMLGFDDKLHRLGYGGGYYDRFLVTQPQARKIGVCFEMGKVGSISADSHDIPMDVIVTEAKIHTK